MLRDALHIAFYLILALPLLCQREATPLLQAGDTLYKSWDLLPQNVDLTTNAEDNFWDLNGLLAPYVHEIYLRPVPSRLDLPVNAQMAYIDAFDVERFFSTSNGATYIVGYGINLLGKGRVIGKCDPPMLLRNANARVGNAWSYTGTVTFELRSGMELAPDVAVNDSVRVILNVQSTTEIAGAGEVLTPAGLYDVMYKREDVVASPELQVLRENGWETVNTAVSVEFPRDLATGRIHTFLSNSYADPVAVVYADIFDNLSSVEFRSSPRTGRVVRTSPKVPDVFVYPNPSFGQVRFDFVNLPSGFYQIEVYNILGVKVRTEDVFVNGTRTVPMDLTDLKKGTYIYRLVDAQKNALRSKRLVIITP